MRVEANQNAVCGIARLTSIVRAASPSDRGVGSVTRGEAGIDSDYDLVIAPDNAAPERQRGRLRIR